MGEELATDAMQRTDELEDGGSRPAARRLPLMSGVQWGTVGEWVGGLATAAALGAAAWELRRTRGERRRRYAENVHVHTIGAYRFARDNSSSMVKVQVANQSPGPVYDVRVGLLDWSWTPESKPMSEIGVAVLPAGMTTDLIHLNARDLSPPKEGHKTAPVRLVFRDPTGMQWRRLPDGRLQRLIGDDWREDRS